MNEDIAFNQITFSLPARQFVIDSSVTVNESLPKVTEFVLRLIRLCEVIEPEEIGHYFGLTPKEVRLLLESLSDQSLIAFDGKVVKLTTYAESKFYTDDDLPRFSVVKPRKDVVDFDLLTFNPIENGTPKSAPNYAVEISVDSDQIGESKRLAERAYHKHFQRILKTRESTNDKIDIYKISNVKSEKLFGIPLEVGFHLGKEASVERLINFEEDAPEEYKLNIEASISNALQRRLNSGQHSLLMEFVNRFEDKVIGQYLSKTEFHFSRYVNDVHVKKNVSYSGTTQALIGNLYMPENAEKILSAVEESLPLLGRQKASTFQSSVAWLAPDYPFWGKTSLLDEFYFNLQSKLPQPKRKKDVSGEEVRLLYPGSSGSARQVQNQYWSKKEKSFHLYGGEVMGGRVEVLLLPTCLTCVLFHFATPGNTSALVPFGFMSRSPDILKEAHLIIREATDNGQKYEGKVIFQKGGAGSDTSYEDNFGFLNYCGA